MPNWCNNDLTISHPDPAKLDELCEAYKEARLLDYARPMPKELLEGEDWYHWRVENWGTKWEVQPDCEIMTASPTEVSITFSTAWSPPIGALEALCEKGFTVSNYYIEEGMGYLGHCYGSPDEGLTDIECDIDGDIDEDVAKYFENALDEHKEWLAEQEQT